MAEAKEVTVRNQETGETKTFSPTGFANFMQARDETIWRMAPMDEDEKARAGVAEDNMGARPAKKITIRHQETGKTKTLTPALFKSFMEKASRAGEPWQVAETEVVDNSTPSATAEYQKRLEDLGALLERERRQREGWTLRVLTACLGGHEPHFPHGVTAAMVLDTATDIAKYTQGFPNAIKAACKVHGVTSDYRIADDYKDDWE